MFGNKVYAILMWFFISVIVNNAFYYPYIMTFFSRVKIYLSANKFKKSHDIYELNEKISVFL